MWDNSIAHCLVLFTETYFEKDGFYATWNHQNPEKNDNYGKSSKFPGIPGGPEMGVVGMGIYI